MNDNWSSRLQNMIPRSVSADKVSMYTIALEGWRRGLSLKFFAVRKGNRNEINYAFIYKGEAYPFAVSKGNKVTKESMMISKNKDLTKEYLTKAAVPVPKGRKFEKQDKNEMILDAAESIGYPVVLKPTNANLGKGVIPNIPDRKELAESLKYVRDQLGYFEVIVEQHIEGDECRVYVIGDKVAGAVIRIPANIIGDGELTINQLINKKNKERSNNPNLRGRLIKIDAEAKKYIRQANYTLHSVLEKNEQLFLRGNSNITSGGEAVDVTDDLTKEMKQIAIEAVKAIPGMAQAGVDVMINKENNTGAVIELNTRPDVGGHLFPATGKPRNVPREIINYYFPTEKEIPGSEFLYFDFFSIKKLLNSGIASEVTVPPIPNEKIVVKKIELTGNVHALEFKRWVQRIALSYDIQGSIKAFPDKEAGEIIAAGSKDKIKQFIHYIQKESPQKIKIKEFDIKDDVPVKIGFQIRKTEKSK